MKQLSKHLLFTFLFLAGAASVFAQKVVTGTVISGSDNSPLIGATVAVKGTADGTITDIDGVYSVRVPANDAVLMISYTGYETQEVAVLGQSTVNVSMKESATGLSEVVVTGYNSQSRKDITGSVSVVDTKDMTKLASSNFVDQLQGKVAGVQMSTSGDPGASVFVRIRGYGSINNNEPLYVIDGVPVSNETSLNFLNPNDIETMQVLKDASAASQYGSRAANGVIVITTKKGKVGKSKISLNIFTGTQAPTKYPDLLDPAGLLELGLKSAEGAGVNFADLTSLYVNNGGNWALPDYIVRAGSATGTPFTGGVLAGDPIADPKNYFLTSDPLAEQGVNYLIQEANQEGTKWFEEVFNSAPMTSYQLAVQGGTDGGSYYISANYYDHEGILLKNDYNRYQTRVNTEFKVKNAIRIGQNLNFAYQTGRGGVGNPNEGSAIMNSYRMPSIVPVRDINGYYGGGYGTNSNAGSPVAQQERIFENKGHSIRTLGDIHAEIDLFKFLTFRMMGGLDYNTGRSKNYTYRNFEATEVNSANALNETQFTNTNWIMNQTLKFSKGLTDDIHADVVVGHEARKNHYVGFNANGNRLPFGDDPNYRVLGNVAGNTMRVGGYEGENSKESYFGNANLNFMDKYLVSGTIRRDGSSKFRNNRWGTFSGVSAGWKVSNEGFMDGVTAVSNLKLRLSYGQTGNDEAGGDYPGYSAFGSSPGTSSYDISGTGSNVVTGFEQTASGNPDLKWETTKMLDFGLDFTLFNKLEVVFDWYDRTTEDMIYGLEPAYTTVSGGFTDINIGDMSNKGIDLQLNYKGKAGDLGYNVGVTYSRYKNEITKLDANQNTFVTSGGSRINNITYTTAGFPMSQFRGYFQDGIWASQEEINSVLTTNTGDAKPGRFKFRDVNGDGEIGSRDDTIIGSPHPDFYYGLNLTFDYKGFDLTMYFQGVQGNEIFNYVKYFTHTPAFQANYAREMLTEAGKSLPVLDANDNYSNQRSSFYVEDGSYFRAKNIQLGYTFGKGTVDRVGIDKIRLYVQAQNLFTITNYSGLDPDVSVSNITEGFTGRRDFSIGIDYGRYPASKTFIIGVNADF